MEKFSFFFFYLFISVLANELLFCLMSCLLFAIIQLLLPYPDLASMNSLKLSPELILFSFVSVFILICFHHSFFFFN